MKQSIRSFPEQEDEEEYKSANDFDSKKKGNSIKTIEKFDLKSLKSLKSSQKEKIKIIKNEEFLMPNKKKKSNYSKMLHFSNLTRLSSKLDDIKILHKNYYLINYFNTSTVRIFFL